MIRIAARLLRLALAVLGLVALLGALVSCLPEPTPVDGGLAYSGPIEMSVGPGDQVPGTDLIYVGITDGMAEFIVEDQKALKKIGDSLDWKGDPIEGIHLDLSLRVLLITEQSVHIGGKVALQIDGAVPQASDGDVPEGARFTVPVTYGVDLGEAIPGTQITYEGRDPDKGAQLGIADYAYRKVGDSIVWKGTLRSDTWLELDLRVLYFNDESLQVGGLAAVSLQR